MKRSALPVVAVLGLLAIVVWLVLALRDDERTNAPSPGHETLAADAMVALEDRSLAHASSNSARETAASEAQSRANAPALDEATRLHGIVVDESAHPIAGAEVALIL